MILSAFLCLFTSTTVLSAFLIQDRWMAYQHPSHDARWNMSAEFVSRQLPSWWQWTKTILSDPFCHSRFVVFEELPGFCKAIYSVSKPLHLWCRLPSDSQHITPMPVAGIHLVLAFCRLSCLSDWLPPLRISCWGASHFIDYVNFSSWSSICFWNRSQSSG